MKRNKQKVAELYNPAREDKKKLQNTSSPMGRTIQFAPGCSVIVPFDATEKEIQERVGRAQEQLTRSKRIETNPIYKYQKEKLLKP